MSENKVLLNNGLSVSIDWLAFTVQLDYSVEDVIEFMGFNLALFREMPNGANGYKRMRKYNDISILYDGSTNMGIHVCITGNSICTLLKSYKDTLQIDTPFGRAYDMWEDKVFSHFLNSVLKIGQLSRLDLAIDDIGALYFDLDDITRELQGERIVTKWKTYKTYLDNVFAGNEKVGHSIYFGSRKSEIMLRIYDKKLEQNRTLSVDDEKYIHSEWVRWELELHKGRADKVAELISKGIPLGEVAIGVLSHYFRIIQNDDCNKSRCSNNLLGDMFVSSVRSLRITTKKEERSMDDTVKTFERQNMRTIAKIWHYKGGDMGYFSDLACRGNEKLTLQDKIQLGLE